MFNSPALQLQGLIKGVIVKGELEKCVQMCKFKYISHWVNEVGTQHKYLIYIYIYIYIPDLKWTEAKHLNITSGKFYANKVNQSKITEGISKEHFGIICAI